MPFYKLVYPKRAISELISQRSYFCRGKKKLFGAILISLQFKQNFVILLSLFRLLGRENFSEALFRGNFLFFREVKFNQIEAEV